VDTLRVLLSFLEVLSVFSSQYGTEHADCAITSVLRCVGQKTLIGVAFLVALASLRNFPVYLMDELDAALDPENQKVCLIESVL